MDPRILLNALFVHDMTSRVNILTIVGKRLPPASSAHKEYDQDYNDDNAKEENGHPNRNRIVRRIASLGVDALFWKGIGDNSGYNRGCVIGAVGARSIDLVHNLLS